MCVRLFVMYCVMLCGLFVCLCWLVFACVRVSCISVCVVCELWCGVVCLCACACLCGVLKYERVCLV